MQEEEAQYNQVDEEYQRRMIVIDERAIAMRCLFSIHHEIAVQTSQLRGDRAKPCNGALRDNRTNTCAVRSVVAGRSLARQNLAPRASFLVVLIYPQF